MDCMGWIFLGVIAIGWREAIGFPDASVGGGGSLTFTALRLRKGRN